MEFKANQLWVDDLETQKAMRHVAEGKAAAMGDLVNAALRSTDPAVRAEATRVQSYQQFIDMLGGKDEL
jgi:hypothetical protein